MPPSSLLAAAQVNCSIEYSSSTGRHPGGEHHAQPADQETSHHE
jgi:hypothetical protein